jgi:localization factor PodJL
VPEITAVEPASGEAAALRHLSRLQGGSTGEATRRSPETDSTAHLLPAAMGTAELRSAAAAGDAQAQLEIATRFAQGMGVAQDHGKAFSWYERAATRGLAAAQFRLAAYYERGIGVTTDPGRARVWYQRAAEQGHARAMHNLAVLSVAGSAADADFAAAARWFRQAAERGVTDSQFNLGVLHEGGRGVAKDLPEAYKWYALAARSGDPVAARRLEQIKARLNPSAIAAAERLITAWQPTAQAAGDPVAESGR